MFARQPVEQNLRLGAYTVRDERVYRERLEQVYGLFPRLKERREQLAGTMSGGERQMLAIGRALMSGPRLLLIDEPSLGLSPLLVEQVFDALAALNRDHGLSVLLVEQNMTQALEVAARLRDAERAGGAVRFGGGAGGVGRGAQGVSGYVRAGRREACATLPPAYRARGGMASGQEKPHRASGGDSSSCGRGRAVNRG